MGKATKHYLMNNILQNLFQRINSEYESDVYNILSLSTAFEINSKEENSFDFLLNYTKRNVCRFVSIFLIGDKLQDCVTFSLYK